jgi:polyisoprenoid-binding protein YceI
MKYLSILLCFFAASALGQKLVSKKSKVTFFSDAVLEDITATTSKANGIIDLGKQEFAFSVPIKEFEFEKSLMKEHFNEKYMESEKFPKGTFLGKIEGFDPASPKQDVKANGKLTIHGVTKEVSLPATMEKSDKGYNVTAKFIVKLEDYSIAIPQLLFQNIAEQVEVTADFNFLPQ